MVQVMATSMMTEWEFWDKFNKKHNPRFYEKLAHTQKIEAGGEVSGDFILKEDFYDKQKKTQTEKTGRSKSTERNPIFKVSN